MANGLPTVDFGSNWTRLTRNVIVTLFVIYVVQLVTRGGVDALFAWQPFGQGFQPWQVATSFLLNGTPISALFSWLALYFFLAPVDSALGRRGLVQSMGITWALSVVIAAALAAAGIINQGVFLGPAPILTALVALFGFTHPGAQILLFFIIPVRAVWLAWGSGLLAFLFFLYFLDIYSTLSFAAWGVSAGWLAVRNGALRHWQLRMKRRQIERKLSKFEVIEGGRTERRPRRGQEPSDWIH
jgi:membrane associated rhomboid family serine protease